MARNQEVIRQWAILRTLDARRNGAHIDELAAEAGVHPRTIRRDLLALAEAGFAVYDERRDNRTVWKIDERLFQRLADVGLSLPELSALYFGRTILECLAGPPFRDDVRSAFQKIARVLPRALKQEIDKLQVVFSAKPDARGEAGLGQRKHVTHLVNAIVAHRRVELRYYSMSSRREKTYLVEPSRIVFGHGALYLRAFVPEYDQMRTFAVNRMVAVSPQEQTFDPRPDTDADPFADSLGINSGSPTTVELEFSSRAAPYVRERVWHPSQVLTPRPDGTLRLRLRVADDVALRTWILGYGKDVRVLSPASLAERVREELEEMITVYAAAPPAADGQERLPFESLAMATRAEPPVPIRAPATAAPKRSSR